MTALLVLKERIRSIYTKIQAYLIPVLKFCIAYFVFFMVNQQIGYDSKLKSFPVMFIMSLICAVTPSAILVLLAAIVATLHIFAASKILSILVVLIFLVLYLLFVRFTPKYGFVVLAVPFLYVLKMPYLVPILLGLTATPITIIPTACGIIVYFLFQVIKEAAVTYSSAAVDESLQIYIYVIKSLTGNKQLILTMGVFAFVILITYFVRRLKISHSFELAILCGALTNILLFLIGDLTLNISDKIIPMIVGTILSMIVAFIVQFFRFTLDYSASESVQFEDDDYYYYVKAVPKLNVTKPEINVKRINIQKATGNTTNLANVTEKLQKESFEDYEESDDYDEYDD